MQIVKIKYSSDNLKDLKLLNFHPSIKFIEVLEIFQYHRMRFFILERITLKDHVIDVEEVIKKAYDPTLFQIIEQKGNEVLCILKLRRDSGFWPKDLSGNWTIIPPIIIDEQFVYETLLIRDNFEEVFQNYSKFLKGLEILAFNKIQDINEQLDYQTQQILGNIQPIPHFSERQREIALYAARHGYYQTPKKIKADALAEKFNISVSALNTHLRKAEQTAMRYFFS